MNDSQIHSLFTNNYFRSCFIKTCEDDSFNIINYLTVDETNQLVTNSIPVCEEHSHDVEEFLDYREDLKLIEVLNRILLAKL